LDFHPEDVIISLINIIVLFILLRVILWKHVIRFLGERATRVRNEMDDAEKSRAEAESLRSQYDEKLEGIEVQRQEVLRDSRQKANEESDRILKETQDKAKFLINDAQTRIENEKAQAIEDAQLEVTQLATEMASHILKREVSAEDTENVVDGFFNERS